MTINESFQLLNNQIQPTENETQAARQHYATIRTRLETEFEVSKCIAVGSFARGTSIHDFSDTDILAVFRKTVFTWGDNLINSDTALEKVRVALAVAHGRPIYAHSSRRARQRPADGMATNLESLAHVFLNYGDDD